MPVTQLASTKIRFNVLVRQTLRAETPIRQSSWTLAIFAFVVLAIGYCSTATAQLYDGLDAYPPRWYLDTSDCDARVISQNHLADGGLDGRSCETITLVASLGTEAILVYPIEPVRAINDLVANVSVMSARDGFRVGFRIRFPYHRDESSRRASSVYVFGASYHSPGKFAAIGVGSIERDLRLKTIAMRREHGSDADLRDPYVDAVIINAYSGPGTTALRIDELRVDGLVPISNQTPSETHTTRTDDEAQARRLSVDTPGRAKAVASNAFPVDQVTRILQHNGEPLAWVRSLGFDAVLLARPPNSEILSEAIRARVSVYAPPPSAPDPSLQTLLEPVAGWYIGSGVALDSSRIASATSTSERLRNWPSVWQRPIIAAPLESRRQYEPLVDAMIHDLPPPIRGLSADEELLGLATQSTEINRRIESAVGISCMPPESLLVQTDAIADRIGVPRSDHFQWHAMWLQAIRALETTPRAILFRSTRSLASGTPMDSQRAMALSYVNRTIAMIAPWIASSTQQPPFAMSGAPYHMGRLSVGSAEIYLLSSVATRGSQVLAGDGASIELLLPPSDAAKTVWRLTHFSAERLPVQTTPQGASIQVVSPDAVEILFSSSDPSLGGQLGVSASRFARQAGLDRWQLTEEGVRRTVSDWSLARSARVLPSTATSNLADIAAQTLAEAEPLFRAGDVESSLRMARRADAWALRSDWQLTEALMPDWPRPTSCPPALIGNLPVQVAWLPLLGDTGWGKNRLPAGSLDDIQSLSGAKWDFGQRLQGRVSSDVSLVQRGAIAGGALQAKVVPLTDEQLPGGYEGTVIQITSPGVRVPAGTAVRIDAMVRTMGFGGPHQGLLIYDNTGGQEMGLLVRGQPGWTPVRLYRQTLVETDVRLMFELIGAGEVMIDDVQLRVWEPAKTPAPDPRPITPDELPY